MANRRVNVILNAVVVTEARLPYPTCADAIAWEGNRILFIGTNDEVMARFPPSCARYIDAKGNTVLPGITDCHLHIVEGAFRLAGLDCTDLSNNGELVKAITAFAKAHPDRSPVLSAPLLPVSPCIYSGYGLPYPDTHSQLTRDILDTARTNTPVLIHSFDMHTGWMNTHALLRIGWLDTRTQEPDIEGCIVRDATGRPTGELRERALKRVRSLLGVAESPADLDLMRASLQHLATLGITSVHCMTGDAATYRTLRRLERDGALPLRVLLSYDVRRDNARSLAESLAEVRALAAEAATPDSAEPLTEGAEPPPNEMSALMRAQEGRLVRFGVLKVFLDGVVESRTACMLNDDPNAICASARTPVSTTANEGARMARGRGEAGVDRPNPTLFYTAEELDLIVHTAEELGLQVAMHAVGPGAVRFALDSIERSTFASAVTVASVTSTPVTTTGASAPAASVPLLSSANLRRHRIEHAELVAPADLKRFAALGVIASVQPAHCPLPDPAALARHFSASPAAYSDGTSKALGQEPGSMTAGASCGDSAFTGSDVDDSIASDPWLGVVAEAWWPHAFPWAALRAAGAHLVFGSDWPVVPADPFGTLATACTLRRPWRPGDADARLPLDAGLEAATRDAVWAGFQEHCAGQLRTGFLADLVVTSEPLFRRRPDIAHAAPEQQHTATCELIEADGLELRCVRAALTVCDGRNTHWTGI